MVRGADAPEQRFPLLLFDFQAVRVGGVLRLRQVVDLHDLRFPVAAEALQVFGTGLPPIVLLQAANAEDQLSHGPIRGMTSSRLARTSSA